MKNKVTDVKSIFPMNRNAPSNIPAERSLLGWVIDAGSMDGVAGLLKASDFYLPYHGKVFEALLDLSELGEPIDPISVETRCKLRGVDIAVVDLADMTAEAVPSSLHAKNHAKIIKETSQKRQTLICLREAEQQIYNGGDLQSISEPLKTAVELIKKNEKTRDDLVIVNLRDVQREIVEWLWESRIPRGKITLFEGDPGVGKSFLSLAIAAGITRGSALPGDSRKEPGNVMIMTAEDGLGDTVRPRLEDMGADLTCVTALQAIKDRKGHQRGVTLQDVELLEQAIVRLKPSLAIVDPLIAYLGGKNEWKASEVRSILAPLAELAEKHHVGMLLIRHLNKSNAKTIYRGQGSIDFFAACRSAFLVGEDPQDSDLRHLCHTKNSLSPRTPSLKFSLRGGVFSWEGESDLTPDQILAPTLEGADKGQLEEVKDFLRAVVKDGPVLSTEIMKQARQAGISERTLWRAKTALRVKTDKKGDEGGWRWYLPR